jgi:6-pyruvoyltetrahydropterin/6-carboxytetrahydropterin synthase
MKISKQLKFEAGHRLAKGYPGNCQHIHGHSYTVTVEMISLGKLNNYGFVKDFNDFKPLKTWIDDNWDHAFLVAKEDKVMLDFLRENDQRHYEFENNPTAEYIAAKLFEVASKLLNDKFSSVTKVLVNETATSEAEYTSADHYVPKEFNPTITQLV